MAAAPERNTTVRWRQLDARHHFKPFSDNAELNKKGGALIIEKADGITLTDSEGRELLDGMAGLWCVNIGYGRDSLAKAAYEQMLELPYYNTFFKTATPPTVELAEKLVEITPEGLEHVFFGSSGSEANDTIVRMVKRYWNVKGKKDKKIFLSREYAYHGSTMASASLGGMTPMHTASDLPLAGFEHVMPPYWYDYGGDMSPEEFGLKAAQAFEDKILELGADKVAAIIGEPVMGAGGVIVPPSTYWPEVQRICEKYDVLLIADEVICGFGPTGNWFGCDTFDIKPDLMPMAKGITSGYLPLSAVMVGKKVGETLFHGGGEFAHGYTYSGHPACCAVAIENIRVMEEEGLVEKVGQETGPYLQEKLQDFLDHPLVGEVRGVGLLGSLELVKDKASRTHFDDLGKAGGICRDHCMDNAVVLRAVRDCMVMSPPLIMEKKDIDEMLNRARRALDATARDLGKM